MIQTGLKLCSDLPILYREIQASEQENVKEIYPAPRNLCAYEAVLGGQFNISAPSTLHYKSWKQYEVNTFKC